MSLFVVELWTTSRLVPHDLKGRCRGGLFMADGSQTCLVLFLLLGKKGQVKIKS